jgi:glutamate dehydrogenase (NAD(P)+)
VLVEDKVLATNKPRASRLSFLPTNTKSPWDIYLEQIARVAPHLPANLQYWLETLKRPKRILVVDVPVHLDDGTVQHFEGYRIHHNTSRGPAKGGVRFHQDVTLDEVMALAAWMTIKNAALGLPYGGGKGGIRVNPREHSTGELERLTRRYTSEIGIILGPDKDIPAPDVGTSEREMAWMMDTYSINKGFATPGVVTGKPISLGGSLGRKDATGRGVFVAASVAAKKLGLSLEGSRVVIQGFGNVGGAAARIFFDHGAKIVALSDVTGAIYNKQGLDPYKVQHYVAETGGLKDYPEAEAISASDLLTTPCEILVPAALEKQLTAHNAAQINAVMVVEGANGPTTPEADDILRDNNILVVPDVIANAGGVTVSYFEWVQDFNSYFWNEEEINSRLTHIMTQAFEAVWHVAEERSVSLRTAAYIVACSRVLEARDLRGLYP